MSSTSSSARTRGMGLQREVIEYSRGKVFAEPEFISHVLLNWIVTTRRLGTCYLFIYLLLFSFTSWTSFKTHFTEKLS